MAITNIKRDWGDSVSIVRIISTNTLSEVGTSGYLTLQEANIQAVNNGVFSWLLSDMALVYASDGWGFFQISSDFTSLVPFAFSQSVVGAPVVVGNFAVFQSTSGNLEDLGYLPTDASKTRVVMAGSSVVANHIALFQDTTGTIDDTAATAINSGSIQAGLSGTAGTLISFPSGATSGELIVAAVTNSSGNFNTTISNASAVAQSQVVSIPDSGASTANFLLSKSSVNTQNVVGILTSNSNPVVVSKVVTATSGALASAGKVNVFVAPTGTAQIAILDVKVLNSTGLSGNSGNRLLSLTDGTLVFNSTGITAALLGTPIFTLWGGTGNTLPSSSEVSVSTAGENVYLQSIGGSADYNAGSVTLAITYTQVTA